MSKVTDISTRRKTEPEPTVAFGDCGDGCMVCEIDDETLVVMASVTMSRQQARIIHELLGEWLEEK